MAKKSLKLKKLRVPNGQIKALAVEFKVSANTASAYLSGRYDRYSSSYAAQMAMRETAMERYGDIR